MEKNNRWKTICCYLPDGLGQSQSSAVKWGVGAKINMSNHFENSEKTIAKNHVQKLRQIQSIRFRNGKKIRGNKFHHESSNELKKHFFVSSFEEIFNHLRCLNRHCSFTQRCRKIVLRKSFSRNECQWK